MAGSSNSNAIPLSLQDTSGPSGFPPHILEVLDVGKGIQYPEIFCRLVHVCMVEVGFIPILNEESTYSLDQLSQMGINESMFRFMKDLRAIVERSGSLHNVKYKAIVFEEETDTLPEGEIETAQEHNETESAGLDKRSNLGTSNSFPVVTKESGDGFASSYVSNEESLSEMRSIEAIPEIKWKKGLHDDISVCIIHEGYEMYVVASSPGVQKNIQMSIPRYSRPLQNLPASAKADDYLKIINFSARQFADDVKKKFCHPIMDEINGLSYDIRSLAWMPPEIIVHLAKHCTPLSLFRLRATCLEIRSALCATNQQFWRMVLKRDFPQCNIANMEADISEDKYYKKYRDQCNNLFRRPLRRTGGRIFPFYLLNNFRAS